MKLGRLQIRFSRKAAPTTGQEIGSSTGENVMSYFNGEVINTSKVKIKDLNKMLDNDGTAQALYLVFTNPILGSGWKIEPYDTSDEAKKQAEFVESVLRKPPEQGGMSTPMDLVLEDMLRAVVEGFRVYEKVYSIQDGKIVYSKIASRDTETVTLREDDRGGFNGITQQAIIGNEFKYVSIPREKCFLFTYNKSRNWLYGRSAFTSAYYHYDKKHRAYYLENQRLQASAIPMKLVKQVGSGNQGSLDDAVDAVDELGFSATVGVPGGYEVDPLNLSNGMSGMELINHHNAEMSRSILAQFMMLGTGSSTGSWALSSDQSDMFIQALESLVRALESHITSYLLPDLVDYNFETQYYPRFKFNKLSDSTKALLKEFALKVIEKSDGLPQDFVDAVMDKVKAQLEINIKTDGAIDTNTPPAGTVANSKKKDGQVNLADTSWRRDLTSAESKVNFSAIQKKMNTLETDFVDAVEPVYKEIKQAVAKNLEKLVKAEDYKAIAEQSLIPTQLGDKYRKLINDQMLGAYNFAKTNCADEMGVNAPATKSASKDLIKQEANTIVEKQFNDINFQIRNEVNKQRRNGQLSRKADLSLSDLIGTTYAVMDSFFESKISLTGSVIVAKAINIGRDDVFKSNDSKISSYQYSAIMDDVTCPTCEDLDGSVVSPTEYRSTTWTPPIHFNCRCIWVEILKDEEDQPDITGIPEEAGGISQPELSNKGLIKRVEDTEKQLSIITDLMRRQITEDELRNAE